MLFGPNESLHTTGCRTNQRLFSGSYRRKPHHQEPCSVSLPDDQIGHRIDGLTDMPPSNSPTMSDSAERFRCRLPRTWSFEP